MRGNLARNVDGAAAGYLVDVVEEFKRPHDHRLLVDDVRYGVGAARVVGGDRRVAIEDQGSPIDREAALVEGERINILKESVVHRTGEADDSRGRKDYGDGA